MVFSYGHIPHTVVTTLVSTKYIEYSRFTYKPKNYISCINGMMTLNMMLAIIAIEYKLRPIVKRISVYIATTAT